MKATLKSILILICALLSFDNSNAATIYFNNLYQASGNTYTITTQSYTSISLITGSGFSFTSNNPADPNFGSGNNVNGLLSYINASGTLVQIYGTVSRQDASGSTTKAVNFIPATNNTYTTYTGNAYIIVAQGQESNYTAGATVNTSSSPVSSDLNSMLSAQVLPKPSVLNFSPSSGNVGSQVTIIGSGFDAVASNNIVYFGDVKATIVSATASQIIVNVPKGSIYEVISVGNLTTGKYAQSSLKFMATNTAITACAIDANSFSAPVNITSVAGASNWYEIGEMVAVADFDLDGNPDVAKAGNTAVVNVLRNAITSSGSITASSFTSSGNFTVGSAPFELASADIDGDGKLDLVSIGLSNFSVLRNTSTVGTISFATKVDVSSSYQYRVKLADVDGDGKIDVITGSNYGSNFNVYLNTSTNGSISFNTTPIVISGGGLGGSRHFTIGDVNMDGKMDVLCASESSMDAKLFINTSSVGSVSFAAAVSVANGYWYNAVGDFNNDGKNDIYALSGSSGSLSVNNYVSGTFTSAALTSNSSVGGSDGLSYVGLADFSGDGKLDFVTTFQNSGQYITWSKNNYTSGSFSSSTFSSFSLYSFNTPYQVVLCDFDGDNKLDILTSASSNSFVQIARNKTCDNPTVTATASLSSFSSCAGSASTPQTITVGGTNLTNNLTLSAVTGFEYSTDNITYSSTLSITPINNSVASTTVYVRLSSTAAVGTPTGAITIASTGATSVTVNLAGTVNAVPTVAAITGVADVCKNATITLASTTTGGTWSSSNTGVATVSGGVVTGVNTGTAVISYAVTNSGCTTTQTKTISVNANPTASITSNNVSCYGLTNGSATVTVSGGTAPYTYVWGGSSSTTNIASNLGAGKVKCTITDAKGCKFPNVDSTVISTGSVNQFVSAGGNYTYNFNDPIPSGYGLTVSGVKINATINFGFSGAFFAGNGWYIDGTNVGGSTVGGSGAMDYPVTVDYNGPVSGYVYGGSNNMLFSNVWNGVTFKSATITLRHELAAVITQPAQIQLTSATTIPAICNNGTVNYTPVVTPAGTTYSWIRPTIAGISTASSTGTGNISETLTNTTNNPITVPYTFSLLNGGCLVSQIVSTVVNPTPVITSTLTPSAVTTGSVFNYTVSGSTGATFSWSRATVTGISNASATGTNNISETLVNTTNAPVTVSYVYTITIGSCTNTQTVSVVVNPIPSLTSSLTASTTSGTLYGYTPTSAVTGTTYSWTRAVVLGINNAAGSGTGAISETLINTTPNPINVTYVITSTANGVTNTQNLVVTVNPIPVLSSSLTATAISNAAFTYTPTSATTGTTYSWSRATVAGISNAAATGTGAISETLINTTANPINVTYVITLTANGVTNTQNVVVTVNPIPVLTSTLTPAGLCNGSAFTYTPTSATTGTTYSWSRATVVGISNTAATGTGAINETLNNTTANPINVTYVYTLTANGVTNTQSVVVTINAVPTLTSTLSPASICNNATFNYTPTSATTGASFSWSRAVVSGISNTAGTGTGAISEVLTNSTANTLNVVYAITTSANGCNNTQNVTVAVQPTPTLSTSLTATAGSGNPFNYIPNSATTNITAAGWSRAVVAGISNAAASSASGIINETLINTTAAPVVVSYVYTLAIGSCINTQTVNVTVNPRPTLTSGLTSTAVNNTPFTYTPTSATTGTTYSWSRAVVAGISNAAATGTGSINETLINTTANPINVTYVITLTANGVTNIQNVVVTVYPTPTLTSSLTPSAVCSGATFNYTPTSATTGTTYSWNRNAVAGISNAAATGTGAISEALVNTTLIPVTVNYDITLSANGVNNTQTVSVVINPLPVLTSGLTPNALCNVSPFFYIPSSGTPGTTYAWSRAAITGIANAAATGTGNIVETINNTTANPITVNYVYTATANGCSNPQTVAIVIKPTPTLSSALSNAPACNNTVFAYTATSATAGTTFAWSRAAVTGISNAAASGTGASISETLVNTTAAPITVTYVFTLTANSCTNTQNVTVVVNPTSLLSSTLAPASICNNTAFTYTPTSATNGTTYAWSRAAVAGISNAAATGVAGINETLINTTANPITVNYVYTLTANACTNTTTQTVAVVVKPTPVLSSTLTPAAQCNAQSFNYTATSATAGTNYTWSRAAVAGITPATGSGSSAFILENLVNTTANPLTVNYVVNLNANGCTNTQTFSLTINSTPVLSSTLNAAPICNNTTFAYTPTTATTGTTFAWSRAAVSGISNAAATGTGAITETLVNTTQTPLVVSYVYVLTANGCSNTQTVNVTVNPTPQLSSLLTTATCNNATFSYTPTSAVAGATYAWSRAAVTGVSNAAATGTGAITETLNNTTANPVVVTYTITSTANGCSSNTQAVNVTVNPTPQLSSSLTTTPICSNTNFSYTPTSATAGTNFAWTRASVAGISNAAGNGMGSINEALVNTTANPVTVNYVYVLTANNCTAIQNFNVTVNPAPSLTSSLAPAGVCSNTAFAYTPTSATAGTTFAWSRAAVAGISNASATGTGAINETLINTAAGTVNPKYLVTLTANGCSASQFVQATVYPTPVLSSGLTVAPACSGTETNYTAASATAGTTFAWSRAAVAGISNAAATGTGNIKETLTNTSASPVNVNYVYTLTANTCTNTQTVATTINPKPATPVITALGPTTFCVEESVDLQVATVSGGTYNWYYNGTNLGVNANTATVNLEGDYTATVTNTYGCTSATSAAVSISTPCSAGFAGMPTVFTPNGDGENDMVYAVIPGIKELKNFSIYNRWGNKVFDTQVLGTGWDGKFKDLEQPADVYFWYVEGVDSKGNTLKKQGKITLAR